MSFYKVIFMLENLLSKRKKKAMFIPDYACVN